jgi:hypothetical protein
MAQLSNRANTESFLGPISVPSSSSKSPEVEETHDALPKRCGVLGDLDGITEDCGRVTMCTVSPMMFTGHSSGMISWLNSLNIRHTDTGMTVSSWPLGSEHCHGIYIPFVLCHPHGQQASESVASAVCVPSARNSISAYNSPSFGPPKAQVSLFPAHDLELSRVYGVEYVAR